MLCFVFVYGFCMPLFFLPRIAGVVTQVWLVFSYCRSPMRLPLVAANHLRRTCACSWKVTAMKTEGWNRMLRVSRC